MTKTNAERLQQANTILDQLSNAPEGSNSGAGRLKAMIGASGFAHSETGVSFTFKGSRKWHTCQVVLNGKDLYDVSFYKYTSRSGLKQSTTTDLYAEDLAGHFNDATGLYTSFS